MELAEEAALRIPKGSTVVGWSLGGTLALMIAFFCSQKVDQLVLIGSTACFGCLWEKRELRGFLLKLRKERGSFLEEFRSRAYPRHFDDYIDIDQSSKLLEDYFLTDVRRYVPHIKVPITMIHGINDDLVPIRAPLELYNLAKDGRLITFYGGHFPEDEDIILRSLCRARPD